MTWVHWVIAVKTVMDGCCAIGFLWQRKWPEALLFFAFTCGDAATLWLAR